MNLLTNIDFWQNIVLVSTLILMIIEHNRQRKDSRRAIYHELHSGYLSFLQYTIQNPHLGLTEFTHEETQLFATDPKHASDFIHAVNLMVALWENAFLMRDSMSKGQWKGWEDWIRDYLKKSEEVRTAVKMCVAQYDPEFIIFINNYIYQGSRL